MRLKKNIVKLTYKERYVLKIIFALFCLFLLINPIVGSDINVTYKKNINLSDYVFAGERKTENKIDNNIGQILYLENDEYKTYFINMKTGKELEFYDILKEESINDFNNKVNDLLLLKYPKKIVESLKDYTVNYYLDTQYLIINYYHEKEDKDYSINVSYSNIIDYLDFTYYANADIPNESGFDYSTDKVSIVFTFDDGPSGDYTKQIIDILEDYKMSATFFMVGNKLAGDPDTVKYVYNSHSEVAYHSFAHTSFPLQSSQTIKDEFNYSNNIFNEITGGSFKYTRPPYGEYNQTTLNSIENAFVRWNIDTNDWRYKDIDHIVNEVLDKYEEGSIILFHDSYETTVESVGILAEELYNRGVQVLSITDYANLRGITLENHNMYFNF